MEELTQEEIQNSINAAYDSVNLINELNSKKILTEEDVDSKNRNIQHIEIMLAKEWFLEALSEAQVAELQNVIK